MAFVKSNSGLSFVGVYKGQGRDIRSFAAQVFRGAKPDVNTLYRLMHHKEAK